MSNINPVIDTVAERIYVIARGRNGRSFEHLEEWNKAEWRRRAGEAIQPMLDAAAEAYSRSGNEVLPEHLDVETDEIAEKVGERFADWRRAFRSSTEEYVGFPNHAVSAGLAALAALRAAFGWSPSKTAPEIVDEMRPGEQQTEAGDQVRLHLASEHAYPIALGGGDGEAESLHIQMHGRGQMEHEHNPDDLRWSEDEARAAIEAGFARGQFLRPLREHLDRAPHTVDYDALRLHLLSAHCLINAAELRDHEVVDAHEHEHDGPGTIRNHPREDRSWTIAKIHDVLDDLHTEPEEQQRYLNTVDATMRRMSGEVVES